MSDKINELFEEKVNSEISEEESKEIDTVAEGENIVSNENATKKAVEKEEVYIPPEKEYTRRGKRVRVGFGLFFIYLTVVMFTTYFWSLKAFTNLTIENMLFQIKVPVGGTEMSSFMDIILYDTVGAVFVTALIMGLYKLYRIIKGKIFKRHFGFSYGSFIKLTSIAVVVSFVYLFGMLGGYTYVVHQVLRTKLYNKYYVDPEYTEITFPENKRNVIYIMLESMEISFTDPSAGGIAKDNYLPLLTDLALDNECFKSSASTTLNGPIAPLNTEWTVASYVAQTSGVPLSIPVARNAMNGRKSFVPGAYSSFQILEENGYNQTLIIGSQETFSGIDVYIKSHGNAKLKGYNYYNKNLKLPVKDYWVWWGYEDKLLFQFAKEEIMELAALDEPFAVSMMTIDTHRVGGYYCSLCEKKYDNQYSNVIACSDKQITDFINWIKEQDFYDNTTIVIVGDHPTMDGDYVYGLPGYSKKYQRKQYFTIINSVAKKQIDEDRVYTTMDVFPTFLAAMGAEIKGDRLGLGVNLFSNERTLAETMGIYKLNEEIAKKSNYYQKYILYGDYPSP